MSSVEKLLHDQKDSRVQVIKQSIRTIPHWPKQGIMFRDITTMVKDPIAFKHCIDILSERYKKLGVEAIAGIESRGFILGAPVAYVLGVPFVMIRKKGKLPATVVQASYEKEYGLDIVEMHSDSLQKGQKVVLIDDLIATGGTLIAGCELIEKVGAVVQECACIVELPDLGGRSKLKYPTFTVVEFEGE